ncbi:MAG: hypothetical protein J0M02_06865 [Planctomycetes bacterium]|nr:hypothetical protein [Planctomycetota bacterium]
MPAPTLDAGTLLADGLPAIEGMSARLDAWIRDGGEVLPAAAQVDGVAVAWDPQTGLATIAMPPGGDRHLQVAWPA